MTDVKTVTPRLGLHGPRLVFELNSHAYAILWKTRQKTAFFKTA